MSNSETEAKAKVVNNKKYDTKYYEKVAGVKVACDVCSREVTRGNLPKHKKSKTCQKIAGEQLRERIHKMVDDADSSSGGYFSEEENDYRGPIVASREVCNHMREETKAPGFDFDKWFARWCPDDGRTVCYTVEDEKW